MEALHGKMITPEGMSETRVMLLPVCSNTYTQ